MLRCFHDGMEEWANVYRTPIEVKDGMNQGKIPTRTIFPLDCTRFFYVTFKNCDYGVYIDYLTSENLLNIR